MGTLIQSAGAIVFRVRGRRREYLLLRNARGHWDFPKGKREPGEDFLETVHREAREETGLTDLMIQPRFTRRLRWRYREGGRPVRKQAEFVLARSRGRRVRLSREHRASRWVGVGDALAMLEFANARFMLRTADVFLGGARGVRATGAARPGRKRS